MSPKSCTPAAKDTASIQLKRCHECIQRKVKCDRMVPSCGHCSSRDRVCDYAPTAATARPTPDGSNSEHKTPAEKSSVCSQSATGTDLMQSSCEACKGHRKGCNREAPKCSNCVESTTACVYPSDLTVRRSSRSDVANSAADRTVNSKPKCFACNTNATLCDKNDPCTQCLNDSSIVECIYVLKFNATKEEEVAKPKHRLSNSSKTSKPTTNPNSTKTVKPTTNPKHIPAAKAKPLKHKKEGPACMTCRKHHTTCSRGNPCDLCVEQRVWCVYPPERVKAMKKNKKTTVKDEKKVLPGEEGKGGQEGFQTHEDEEERKDEANAAGEQTQIVTTDDAVSNDHIQAREKSEETSQCRKPSKQVSSSIEEQDEDAGKQKESCEEFRSTKKTGPDVNNEAEATQINEPASNIPSTNPHLRTMAYEGQAKATDLNLLGNLEIPSPTVMSLDGTAAPLSVASKLTSSVPNKKTGLKRGAPETEAYNTRASKLSKPTVRPRDQQPQKVCWDYSPEKGEYLWPRT